MPSESKKREQQRKKDQQKNRNKKATSGRPEDETNGKVALEDMTEEGKKEINILLFC